MAFDEFSLSVRAPAVPALRDGSRASTSKPTGRSLVVRAGATEFQVDPADGSIQRWVVDDTHVLTSPLRPNYWRALTDNDRGFGNFDPRLQRIAVDYSWRDPSVSVTRFDQVPFDGGVRLVFQLKSRRFHGGLLWYDFRGDGSVIAHRELVPPGHDPVGLHAPGAGCGTGALVRQGAARELHRPVPWRGDGHSWLPLADLPHNYMRPQGRNRTAIRWLEVAGSWGPCGQRT